MAKAHDVGEVKDKWCLVCDKTLARWPGDEDDDVIDSIQPSSSSSSSAAAAGATASKTAIDGRYCSHCLTVPPAYLIERKRSVWRSRFRCVGCGGVVSKCRMCKRGAAIVDGGHQASMCAACDHSIKSWDDVASVTRVIKAWCSWCAASGEHRLVRVYTLKRSVYECKGCNCRGVPCTRCDVAMSIVGDIIDDSRCAVCRGKVPSWQQAAARAVSWCARARRLGDASSFFAT